MSENEEIYTAGKKIYTAAGTDGTDKFHLWLPLPEKAFSKLHIFFTECTWWQN